MDVKGGSGKLSLTELRRHADVCHRHVEDGNNEGDGGDDDNNTIGLSANSQHPLCTSVRLSYRPSD